MQLKPQATSWPKMESKNRKIIGLTGGLCKDGRQDNSALCQILENDYGFFRTSPLDEIEKFSAVLGYKKDDKEWMKILNHTCVAGMKLSTAIWINLALKKVPKDKTHILVDDVHFKEEARILSELGGIIVQPVCPRTHNVQPNFEPNIVIKSESLEQLENLFKDTICHLSRSGII